MRAADFRELAREKLRGKWKKYILIMFLATVLGGVIQPQMPQVNTWYESLENLSIAYRLLAQDGLSAAETQKIFDFVLREFVPMAVEAIYGLLLGAWVSLGLLNISLLVLNDESPRLDMLFLRGYYGKALRLHLLRGLLVELGALALTLPVCLLYVWLNPEHFLPGNALVALLVLPGQIVAYRYAMADFLLLNHPEMGVVQALRESGRRMRGRKWKLFCLQLSFIGWALLCILPGVVIICISDLPIFQLLSWAFTYAAVAAFSPYINVAVAAFFRHNPSEAAKEEAVLVQQK